MSKEIEQSILTDLRKKLAEMTTESKPKIERVGEGINLEKTIHNLYIWVKEFNMFLNILYLNYLGPKKRMEEIVKQQTPTLDPLQINIVPKIRLVTPEFEDVFNQYTAFNTLIIERSKKGLDIIERVLKEIDQILNHG